jgi:outer membrane receptor protein involved in Fe transport
LTRGRRRRWAFAAAGLGLARAGLADPDRPGRIEIERTTPPAVVEERAPDARPEDPTAFTHVIEADEFAGENQRVEDLVDRVPGVYVRRFGGPGDASEISIRGATGAQVVVLLDGVRLNSAQSGSVDLSTIPPALIERIEVSRGGGSVDTGSDAIGGVINIVTRRASAKPSTTASGSAGSWDTWKASLAQTGQLAGTEVLLGYDFFKTSGDWEFEPVRGLDPTDDDDEIERINNRNEQHAGLLKLARDLGGSARVELSDSLFHGSRGRPGLDLASGGQRRGQRERAHERRTRNLAQLRAFGVAGTPLSLDWDVRLFHRFDRSRFRDPDLTPPGDEDDVNTALGGRLGLEREWVHGFASQRVSLGGELRRDAFDPRGWFRDCASTTPRASTPSGSRASACRCRSSRACA